MRRIRHHDRRSHRAGANDDEGRQTFSAISSEPRRLRDIEADRYERLSLPLSEFSRVLGGGIVPGSLVLLGGDPGIGKSTLLLQVAGILANQHGRILYISGEESLHQIKMRADRLSMLADDLFSSRKRRLKRCWAMLRRSNPY